MVIVDKFQKLMDITQLPKVESCAQIYILSFVTAAVMVNICNFLKKYKIKISLKMLPYFRFYKTCPVSCVKVKSVCNKWHKQMHLLLQLKFSKVLALHHDIPMLVMNYAY